MTNRRHFLGSCAAATGGVLLQAQAAPWASAADEGRSSTPIIVFAKPLQHLEFDELGRRLQSVGVQGIEATLRRDGQIEPQQFAQQLGRLTEALAKHEQRVWVAASDINDTSADSERQLKQFVEHGIPYFRMSYYRYDYTQPILPQLEAFAQQASELAALCRSLGITALYQNHAGRNYVGAALWDLQRVLSEVDPQHVAVAFDVRHAGLELSQSWQAGYGAIRPHIGGVYVKDFVWSDNQPENVPLGKGLAKPVFEQVKKDGLIGPLSLHVEYIDHRPAELQEARWQAVEQDVATLRQWLA